MEVFKVNEELNMQLKQVSDYSAQLSTDNGNNIVSPAVMFYSTYIPRSLPISS